MGSPQNPRAIFFIDSVVVAWPRGGFIEIAAHDPTQGVIFYTLEQREVEKPLFVRSNECLRCHNSYATLNVPGMLVRSVVTASDGKTVPRLGNSTSDHRLRRLDGHCHDIRRRSGGLPNFDPLGLGRRLVHRPRTCGTHAVHLRAHRSPQADRQHRR